MGALCGDGLVNSPLSSSFDVVVSFVINDAEFRGFWLEFVVIVSLELNGDTEWVKLLENCHGLQL